MTFRKGYKGTETADPSALAQRHSLGGSGAKGESARQDHAHTQATISTGTTGAIAPDDVAAEGVATTLARSDHKHSNVTDVAGASRMNDPAAEGVATSFSRSDHKHGREVIGYQRVSTSQGTTSTSYTDLATTGPAVTLTTGTIVKVSLSTWCGNGTISDGCLMSVAVSGATTRAANDIEGVGITLQASANNTIKGGHTVVIAGLTAGSNVFTAKYRAVTGGTATFLERFLTVESVD
jgi:hypothetical protein